MNNYYFKATVWLENKLIISNNNFIILRITMY